MRTEIHMVPMLDTWTLMKAWTASISPRPWMAALAATLACWLGTPASMAVALQEPAAPPPPAAQPPAAAKTGADPTDFITRIEPSFEHKTLNDETTLDIVTVRTDLALRPNWSIRLDFPLLSFEPTAAATAAGYSQGFGLGDVVTQLSYKPYSNGRMAALTALRLDLNTSTSPGMGQGGTTYAPVAAVAFLRGRWLIAPVLQWSLGSDFDNAPLPGTRDRSELSIRCVTVYQIGRPNITYLLLDPEYIRDFETETSRFTVNLEYGKVVGRGALLLLRPSVGLDDEGGGLDWGFKFAFRQMWPGSYMVK
jgi:hypothetical protein